MLSLKKIFYGIVNISRLVWYCNWAARTDISTWAYTDVLQINEKTIFHAITFSIWVTKASYSEKNNSTIGHEYPYKIKIQESDSFASFNINMRICDRKKYFYNV